MNKYSKKDHIFVIDSWLNTTEKEQTIISLIDRIKEYGMGSVRSLSDYFKFAGIDTKNKKVISRCKSRFDNDKNEWIEQK